MELLASPVILASISVRRLRAREVISLPDTYLTQQEIKTLPVDRLPALPIHVIRCRLPALRQRVHRR